MKRFLPLCLLASLAVSAQLFAEDDARCCGKPKPKPGPTQTKAAPTTDETRCSCGKPKPKDGERCGCSKPKPKAQERVRRVVRDASQKVATR